MTPDIEEALRSGAVRLVPGWQDISTAPKDGTVIDLWARSYGPVSRDSDEQRVYVEFRVADACWFMGEWATAEGGSLDLGGFDNLVFSHWAPRVAPPDTASPDHTPALLALIEERDRLKVENARRLVCMDKRADKIIELNDRALAAEAERDALREALAPFANYYGPHYPDTDDKGKPLPDEDGVGWVYLTVGDFRRARALTQETNDGE